MDRLAAFEMEIWRRIQKISCMEKTSNEEILKLVLSSQEMKYACLKL